MSPHQERMLIERYELYKKELDLQTFIEKNPLFQTLDRYDRDLMSQQFIAMTNYRSILEQRIARFE